MRPVSRLPRLLSIDEVAQQLGVSTKTIRRWLLADYLSCHRLGRQIRIAEDELAAFIRNSRERSGRCPPKS